MKEKELAERRAVLCEKYDKILSLTYHFGVADSERDDVVQEVFVAAYLHLHQLRDIESMDSWLYKIAMRKAGKFGRKSKRKEENEVVYESCEQELDRNSAAEYAAKLDFSDEDIFDMVNSLRPPAPEIIRLRYVSELSMVEIAELLKMNYNSVKTIERRARIELEKMIREGKNETGREGKTGEERTEVYGGDWSSAKKTREKDKTGRGRTGRLGRSCQGKE